MPPPKRANCSAVTPTQVGEITDYLARTPIRVEHADTPHIFDIAVTSGIVCDGAKASCAAKIAAAVDAGLLGLAMYRDGNEFYGGDGIVKKGVEKTIEIVGRLARNGMQETDREIIRLMME